MKLVKTAAIGAALSLGLAAASPAMAEPILFDADEIGEEYTITFDGSHRTVVLEDLKVAEEGELWIDVMDGDARIARRGLRVGVRGHRGRRASWRSSPIPFRAGRLAGRQPLRHRVTAGRRSRGCRLRVLDRHGEPRRFGGE